MPTGMPPSTRATIRVLDGNSVRFMQECVVDALAGQTTVDSSLILDPDTVLGYVS